MEHRLDKRLPSQRKVEIFRSGKSLGHFVVTDVSAGGVAIIDEPQCLKMHDFLELQATLAGASTKTPPKTINVQAFVVQANRRRVGIMFVERQAVPLLTQVSAA